MRHCKLVRRPSATFVENHPHEAQLCPFLLSAVIACSHSGRGALSAIGAIVHGAVSAMFMGDSLHRHCRRVTTVTSLTTEATRRAMDGHEMTVFPPLIETA